MAVELVPPVQVRVRCTACGHQRGGLAMTPSAVTEALRCERCHEPNEVLEHRSIGGLCACCY
jgi:hypothetical protein